jgi:hypothetical protein
MRRRPTAKLERTTLRDFSGGLNVIDNELNLTSKFSPVNENAVRFADGSISPRYGYECWLDMQTSTVTRYTGTVDFRFSNTSRVVEVEFTGGNPFNIASPLRELQHITIISATVSGVPAVTLGGIAIAEFLRSIGIRYDGTPNADTIRMIMRSPATSNVTVTAEIVFDHDTHLIGGNIIHQAYFNQQLVVASDNGEICAVNAAKTVVRIWSYSIAHALGGSPLPWSYSTIIDSEVFGTEMLIYNDIDKPLRIDFTQLVVCDYHVDPGNSNSNALIPAYGIAKSAFQYYCIYDKESGATQLRFAAKSTSCVFTGAPSPGDAVDINIARMISTNESRITGLAVIRNNLLVTTPNASTLMSLGKLITVGANTFHDPLPDDVLSNFGTSAQKSIVEIGNDVFMIDYTGVPSVRLSSQTAAIVPERVSQLIEPLMAKHIGRISQTVLSQKAFSVYDAKNKYIHFCIPKHDSTYSIKLRDDPFYYPQGLTVTEVQVNIPDHEYEVGDTIQFSGATSSGFAGIDSQLINCTVASVLGVNDIIVVLGTPVTIPNTANEFGGGSVTVRNTTDKTTTYALHYIPALRINAWYMFKGLKLTCGAATAEGRTFFSDGRHILRYGTQDEPVYGDYFGKWDISGFTNNFAYTDGQRVLDTGSNKVFKVVGNHTSPSTGTFAQARVSMVSNWEPYLGDNIIGACELPWADFGSRQQLKALKHVHFDASGDGRFTAQVFSDNLYRNRETGQLSPTRSLDFVGSDSAGFGGSGTPFSSGRRTKEQFLWTMPLRFKILKMRMQFATNKSFRISTISFLFQRGGLVRT